MIAINSAPQKTLYQYATCQIRVDIDQYVTYTGLAILTVEIMEICKFGPHGTIFFLLTSESSKYKFLRYPKCSQNLVLGGGVHVNFPQLPDYYIYIYLSPPTYITHALQQHAQSGRNKQFWLSSFCAYFTIVTYSTTTYYIKLSLFAFKLLGIILNYNVKALSSYFCAQFSDIERRVALDFLSITFNGNVVAVCRQG